MNIKGKLNKLNYSTSVRSNMKPVRPWEPECLPVTQYDRGNRSVFLLTRLYQNKQLQQTNAIVNKHYTCCSLFEKKKSHFFFFFFFFVFFFYFNYLTVLKGNARLLNNVSDTNELTNAF